MQKKLHDAILQCKPELYSNDIYKAHIQDAARNAQGILKQAAQSAQKIIQEAVFNAEHIIKDASKK